MTSLNNKTRKNRNNIKYLSHYIEEKQTALFEKTETFFAFSGRQFEEAKKEGVKYVSLGSGMICPEKNVEILINGLEKIHTEGIQQDLAENGKEAIIKRELYNYEAFYTYEIEQVVERLSDYEITEEEVQAVFDVEKHNAE